MAPFSENDRDRLDWKLLEDGAVTLYFRRKFLDLDADWLKGRGYRVHLIDCSEPTAFQWEMTRVFEFKENFGYEPWRGNLDALNDAFTNLDFSAVAGIALCFLRFDLLWTINPPGARGTLDLVEYHSRASLLLGRRLLALVQSDDPLIQIKSIGCRDVRWNQKEWLNDSRRV